MKIIERINRILFILSTVTQHQGIRVDELAAQVGMQPQHLLRELEFITLIGKPPFKPDDYVDIYVEDQRVFVEFDQQLNRPLRLTRPEAMALLLSLALLDPEVDPEGVRSLRAKIEKAVSATVDTTAELEKRIAMERSSQPVSSDFSLIRKAIEKQRRLTIEYYSLTRNQTGRRVIHPYLLLKHLGSWYLTGYCETRKDLRTFKFERILSVEAAKGNFTPLPSFDTRKFKENFLKSMGHHQVKIYFAAPVAPWIREQWGPAVTEGDGGGVILTLFSETLEFPSRLVLGSAPHARPLQPEEFVEKVRQDASEIAAIYAD